MPSQTLEHFRAIVQSSDDAIISKTLDGIVTSWNLGAQAIFGFTEEEMLGRPILAIFPPERVHEEADLLQQVARGAKVDHFETERLHKNGSRVIVSVTISPIRDRKGVIVGASKIARDITHQVRLETSSLMASAILHSTDDAVVAKSLEGVVTAWNPGAERLFGYAPQEIIGQKIQRLLPHDRKEEVTFILEKIRAGETVDHFETIRLCKDGTLKEVSVTISPIRDRFGTIVGASKIARDITARKAAELQLLLTSSVFTATSEGIFILQKDGLVVDVNQAFTRITGFARDEVIGTLPHRLWSGRQGRETLESVRRALIDHGEWRGELWSRRKDGSAYAILMTISRILDAADHPSNYVGLFSDITSLKLQQEHLDYVAHFDALTQLPNRLLLADRLQQAMSNCMRDQILAVLYMDIDGFKHVNDSFGHSAGDELLIALAQAMRRALREKDTLARMGGDEFVVVLPDLQGVRDGINLVNRLLAVCSQAYFVHGQALHVSASVGVTFFPADSVDAEQLIRHADHAMYEAKRTGPGRYHVFDAAKNAAVKHLSGQQFRIAAALERQEFVLHYQPKVNMRTGAVVGAEALIRWEDPEHGLLLPGSFLPLIEKHPLCAKLGNWVLQAAVAQMDRWQQDGLRLPVSVNVAAMQFQEEGFTARLADLLSCHPNVVPDQLELEILETSALGDLTAVQRIILECRELGVRFSIDDFGTGYSSLTYLKRLAVSTLKIDQSFIREMLVDPDNLSLVKGVIGLAKAFNREVIAEGVETDAHGQALLALGCELAQGYAIARAMPARDLSVWVKSWRPPTAWGKRPPGLCDPLGEAARSIGDIRGGNG